MLQITDSKINSQLLSDLTILSWHDDRARVVVAGILIGGSHRADLPIARKLVSCTYPLLPASCVKRLLEARLGRLAGMDVIIPILV